MSTDQNQEHSRHKLQKWIEQAAALIVRDAVNRAIERLNEVTDEVLGDRPLPGHSKKVRAAAATTKPKSKSWRNRSRKISAKAQLSKAWDAYIHARAKGGEHTKLSQTDYINWYNALSHKIRKHYDSKNVMGMLSTWGRMYRTNDNHYLGYTGRGALKRRSDLQTASTKYLANITGTSPTHVRSVRSEV